MSEAVVSIVKDEVGESPERVVASAEGLLHETYLVECPNGEYVVQFASRDAECEDSLARGLRCYERFADSEVPVPAVVTDGVQEFDGRRYGVVERLLGENAERNVSPTRTRNAGRWLARIHDFEEFDSAGYLDFEDGEAVVEEYDERRTVRMRGRVERAAETLAHAGFAAVADAFASVAERTDVLPDETDAVLCHGDFSPDNVLFDDGEVVGVIDFDRARADWAGRDLAAAASAFWMHDPTADWAVRETFYEGYRDVRDVPGFERAEPVLRVVALATTVAGMAELGELTEYEGDFYAERLRHVADRA